MKRIFVYGSLRKGMYNYEKYLRGKSQFIGLGYVKGELFALEDVTYPALLQGDEDILGEIYEIEDAVGDAIDELEGYKADQVDNDYDKIEVDIHVVGVDMTVSLPVYFFNMAKEDNQKMLGNKITCNDYVKYMTQV